MQPTSSNAADQTAGDTELGALLRAIDWTEGLGLVFVRCDTAAAERYLAAQITAGLDRPVIEIELPPERRRSV